MSKRYGRNQKRRDRRRIADLEWEKERLNGRLGVADEAGFALGMRVRTLSNERDQLLERLRRQEEHVKEISDTINRVVDYSALLPPKKLGLTESRFDNPLRIRLAPKRRLALSLPQEPLTIENVKIDILELDLWLLEATLEENIHFFERFVHVLAPGPSGACYRISESVYRQFLRGEAPGIELELCKQIMRVLRDQNRKMSA
jgi:hypothetical protein